jgi:hypothetical protein
MDATGPFTDATTVREHLRGLGELQVTDPGGNTHQARLCPHCGTVMVTVEEDHTLYVDDYAGILGQQPATPAGGPDCRCGELVGQSWEFPDDYNPYGDE